MRQAVTDHHRLISTQTPPGFNIDLLRVDPEQLRAIGDRSLQQITVRHWELNARATESMKHHLTVGTALGHNPRDVTARNMVDAVQGDFEGGLARAQVIARTEQLDAYRAAGKASDDAMADILDHWVWHAELGARTCASCLAMHGTEHPLEEEGPIDHHQGRCTRLPVTKTWEQLGFKGITEPDPHLTPKAGDGERWLESQSETTQKRILGPKRYDAWKDGRYPSSDWTVRKTHWSEAPDGTPRQDWRDSLHVGPVREGDRPHLSEPVTPQPSRLDLDRDLLADEDAMRTLTDDQLDELAMRQVAAGDFQAAERVQEIMDSQAARREIADIDLSDDDYMFSPDAFEWYERARPAVQSELLQAMDRKFPGMSEEWSWAQMAHQEGKAASTVKREANAIPSTRQIRADYDDYLDREMITLEEATNGQTLKPEWRGRISPRSLYSMNWATARSRASEETLQYWQDHGGRMTFEAFKEQATGHSGAATERRLKNGLDW